MIEKGSWNRVHLVCGNHGDDNSHNMELFEYAQSARDAVFYRCPQYLVRYGKAEGKFCNNRITIQDYSAMLEYLTDLADDGAETTNLKGLRWKRKGIEFQVLEDRDGVWTVKMLNRKAVNS